MNDPEAIVLSGGDSRRMGEGRKEFLSLADRSFLSRVLDGLAPVVSRIFVVTRRVDRTGRHLAEEGWSMSPDGLVTVFAERRPGRGPLAAFADGLERASARRVFLAGCDTPFLSESLVRRLLETLADRSGSPSGARAAVPVVEKKPLPVSAAYLRSVRTVARDLLADGRFAMNDLLDAVSHDLVVPGPGESRQLLNVNTPEDLRIARERMDDGSGAGGRGRSL